MLRQIILDTETTGLEPEEGHRIIEIGCIEMIDRKITGNNYHQYIQPDREIDAAALEVHGITQEFLADKPRFEDIAQHFVDYVRDAELIIHNAPFDVGFLDYELKWVNQRFGHTLAQPFAKLDACCKIIDSLVMARQKHPGQRNSLDALCKRYSIDNSDRQLHGALLDSRILADVYLAMTGGQVNFSFLERGATGAAMGTVRRVDKNRQRLPVIKPNEEEWNAHREALAVIKKASGECHWAD